MKKKFFILVVMVLSLSLVGCGGNKVKNAVWEEYKSKSFLDFLQVGAEEYFSNEDYVEVRCEIGWEGFDKSIKNYATQYKKTYTYIVEVYEDDEVICEYKFFVLYNVKQNRIVDIVGALETRYLEGQSDIVEHDEYDAFSLLKDRWYYYQE